MHYCRTIRIKDNNRVDNVSQHCPLLSFHLPCIEPKTKTPSINQHIQINPKSTQNQPSSYQAASTSFLWCNFLPLAQQHGHMTNDPDEI